MAVPKFGGQFPAIVRWWLVHRNPGEPQIIEGTTTINGDVVDILTEGLRGEKGNPGQPAHIIRRDFSLADPEDLPDTDTLDESDYGRAWYIDGMWHVFDHGEWFLVQGSIEGPVGATPDLTVTAEGVEAEDPVTYGPLDVEQTGPDHAPHVHIKIPMIPGPEGPAASIGSASDFDDTDAEVGQVVGVTSITPSPQYGLITPTFYVPRLYTIPHNAFIDHTGSETRFLIASRNIPAQDSDWYPEVLGHVRIARSVLSGVQVEIEVRVGITGVGTGETAPLCALGPYDPQVALLDSASIVHVLPHFSDTINPDRALEPDTEAGRVAAGDAVTFYVFVHKIGGFGSYQFTKDTAQMLIRANPVVSGD